MPRKKKTITMASKMAIATAVCKKKGHKKFDEGSEGEACREKVAMAIERKRQVVKKGPARRKKRR